MQTTNTPTSNLADMQDATALAPMVESAYFSIAGEGVVVDPLITLAVAPGTRREQMAVGIVTDTAHPTPIQAPGVEQESYSGNVSRPAVDVALTVSFDAERNVAEARPSHVVSSASRHKPESEAAIDMGNGVPAPDAELRLPNVEPIEADEITRGRIWARISARLEAILDIEEPGPSIR